MPNYTVKVTYDMGMSPGGEVHKFKARNDKDANKYLKKLEGSWLSMIKRNVHVDKRTLARVVES